MTDNADAHSERPTLAGRRIAVTGGTTGTGRATAVLLASYPDIPADRQREMIRAEMMLRAEDIAVGVHFALTQPRRTVIQPLTIAPLGQDKE